MPGTPCRPIFVALVAGALAVTVASLVTLFTPGGPLLHSLEDVSVGMTAGALAILLGRP